MRSCHRSSVFAEWVKETLNLSTREEANESKWMTLSEVQIDTLWPHEDRGETIIIFSARGSFPIKIYLMEFNKVTNELSYIKSARLSFISLITQSYYKTKEKVNIFKDKDKTKQRLKKELIFPEENA